MKSTHNLPQYLAELIGTFFLVFFGCGSMILAELGKQSIAGFVPVVFGGAVSIMIYATGHISGAHFNPAVTIAFWFVKRFPLARVPGYLAAQIVGATLASLVHILIFGTEHSFGASLLETSVAAGFLIEVIISFALMFVIISVATDSRAVGELAGIAIGTTVALCAFVMGPLTGASMNFARSFGPAVVSNNFSNLWLYALAPVVGTLLAAKVYEWIRCQKEANDEAHGCC